ncbi:hypothetical protein KAR91_05055 [Candidatus Pacearchaeota archaeon]|nr:hypothetical protein [Candidatus Pacearchaeota archaeon]
MSELDNRVSITVNIADATITRPGFGIMAIVHKHQQTTLARVVTYQSLPALLVAFPAYTPVGKAASIAFSQGSTQGGATPETIKVIKQESAETVTQALDAALLVDSDFYGVMTCAREKTDHELGAAWALTNEKLFGYSNADASAITATVTDPFAVIKALSNQRAFGYYTEDAGVEFKTTAIGVAGTTATASVASANTLMKVGDTVGIWTSAVAALNATWKVLTVTASEFTFTVPSGTTPDVAAADCWARMNLLEAALFGKMLPQDAGAKTWDIQELAGVTVDGAAGTTSAKLTDTGRTNLASKNGNWFAALSNFNVTSGLKSNGGGGKTAGGRYIDITRGADWTSVNLQLDWAELLVREAGSLGFDTTGLQKVQTVGEARCQTGLNNNWLTPFVKGEFAGQPYVVQVPLPSEIQTTDRTNRLLTGIIVYANIRQKIHAIEATLNLSA